MAFIGLIYELLIGHNFHNAFNIGKIQLVALRIASSEGLKGKPQQQRSILGLPVEALQPSSFCGLCGGGQHQIQAIAEAVGAVVDPVALP